MIVTRIAFYDTKIEVRWEWFARARRSIIVQTKTQKKRKMGTPGDIAKAFLDAYVGKYAG